MLSHYSYILASGKQALVVDPGRDAATYLEFANKEGLKIMGVFLTHNHADFVAGHLELAKAAGCPVFASAASHDHFQPRIASVKTRRVVTSIVPVTAMP